MPTHNGKALAAIKVVSRSPDLENILKTNHDRTALDRSRKKLSAAAKRGRDQRVKVPIQTVVVASRKKGYRKKV